MEITKREVLASVSIIAILMIIGVIIAGKISDKILDENEKYNKALKIIDKDIFEYGMKTNVGNAFIYGELKALNPVTYPEIGGEYSYVEKVKEKYTKHTRTVTTTVNGKTKTKTETYWTWDVVGRESIKSTKATFLGVEFNMSQFQKLNDKHIETIKESSKVRYKYYASPIAVKGTIFVNLRDRNIGEEVRVYEDMNIDETYNYLESNILLVSFWIMWIVLIALCVYGFMYLENNWLND